MKRILSILIACLLLTPWALGDDLPFIVKHGDRERPAFAITMDDCATISVVEKTFRYCQEMGIHVTFFPIGYNLRAKDAELWQEIAASPLAEIGCHTMNHLCWHKCRKATIGSELEKFSQRLDAVLGYHYEVSAVRPPHGHCTTTRQGGNADTVQSLLMPYGYDHAILWDVSDTNPKTCLPRVQNGSILLFHANGKDLKCIQAIVPKLLEQGLVPVTISELLELEPGATITDLEI